ncbi:MAG: YgjV family protein [Bacillota bacterium]|nr:YgjV family protein [Bacillota bacterium]
MNIIIGNCISFLSALFTIYSSIQKEREKIYFYQIWQCFAMVIASLFFVSYSGVCTFLLCTIRNYLLMKDKYTKNMCYLFMLAIGILGILSNNRGMLGLLPVIGSIIYTYGSLICKKTISIKINIILNLLIWGIYEGMIYDFVSAIVDGSSAIITIYSIQKEKKEAPSKSFS